MVRRLLLLVACSILLFAGQVWAVDSQPAKILEKNTKEHPIQNISFVKSDGAEAPIREDDDNLILGAKGVALVDVRPTPHVSLAASAHAIYLDLINGNHRFVNNHPVEIVYESGWVHGFRISMNLRF